MVKTYGSRAASTPVLVTALVVLNCCFIYLLLLPDGYRLRVFLWNISGTNNVLPSAVLSNESDSTDKCTPESLTASRNSGDISSSHSQHMRFCDLSRGRWLPDSKPPLYSNETCKHMYANQNCIQNGRPDLGYLKWRWWPDDCELPYFDPPLFLKMMKGKRMGFIGDSLARNHMQSLLCSLTQVEEPVNLSKGDKEFSGEMRWGFPAHNFTLAAFWSAFLVKTETEQHQGREIFHLHLDVPDAIWRSQLDTLDLIIVSAGTWYYRSAVYYYNNTLLGTTSNSGLNLTKFDIQVALRMSYESVLKYLVENYKGIMMLRTITLSHFENGSWHDGGYCNKTAPFADPNMELPRWGSKMNEIQVREFEKAVKNVHPDEVSRFSLLNVTWSAFLRPDGHPGIYKPGQSTHSDCLHWCMPGPIDMWNQLILQTLRNKRLFMMR